MATAYGVRGIVLEEATSSRCGLRRPRAAVGVEAGVDPVTARQVDLGRRSDRAA